MSPPSDFGVEQEFWTVRALYSGIQKKFQGSYSKKYKEGHEIREGVEKFFVERSYKMEFEISNYFSD